MQSIITADQESTVPEGAALVGIDAEGRVHYHMAAVAHDDRVFVATDTDDVQVFDLAGTGRDIEDWIAHVDEWDDLRYGEGFDAMLSREMEAGA